jgi:hypothetical protein
MNNVLQKFIQTFFEIQRQTREHGVKQKHNAEAMENRQRQTLQVFEDAQDKVQLFMGKFILNLESIQMFTETIHQVSRSSQV